MQFKKHRITLAVLAASIFTFGCESDLALVESANEVKLEEETLWNGFKLSEITEMTDFTNLRQGDFSMNHHICRVYLHENSEMFYV